MTVNEVSSQHPHEPETPPIFDAEGRCLICGRLVLEAEVARLRAELEHERGVLQFTSQQTDAAELEVDSLRADLDRVLDALRTLEQWDMLSLTPDGHGAATDDAPWARALIRAVLTDHDRGAHDD